MPDAADRPRFLLFLIKPSHYDDDGYVIQWRRSALPSNSLACLYGIAKDAIESGALGPEADPEIIVIDETNTRVQAQAIVRQIAAAGGRGLVGFVGVQSNQFPRVMDVARPLRAAGVQVAIGGFHVSGCLAMLPETPDSLKDALDLGISLFAGEAEGRFADVLRDAAAGCLKPIYNYPRQPAEPRRRDRPLSAEGEGRPVDRHDLELRRRPRLSLPVLVLHDHQRAGAQVALPHRRRHRADRARQSRQRRPLFLHHRRQSRPQPQLGGHFRPADPRCGRKGSIRAS